jgi:hypothetical protein
MLITWKKQARLCLGAGAKQIDECAMNGRPASPSVRTPKGFLTPFHPHRLSAIHLAPSVRWQITNRLSLGSSKKTA